MSISAQRSDGVLLMANDDIHKLKALHHWDKMVVSL